MSVIVKHMEMPKDCSECRLSDYRSLTGETWCYPADALIADNFRAIGFDGRPDWCPLVELPEKHGDLIDRNKLIENKFKNDISYAAFVNLIKRQVAAVKAEGEE